MAAEEKRILLAFDFDHTIIDENSDITVTKLSPGGEIPDEILEQYSDNGWVDYMGAIFRFLHRNGITASQLRGCMEQIPLTEGMKELMELVSQMPEKCDMIIISDSNSVFIRYVLEHYGLHDKFSAVFTNPAVYDDDGCLHIKYYHTQDWCKLSTVNLCKGHILQDFIRTRSARDSQNYHTIIYVGDGGNDLCPGLTLTSKDYLCPREGFSLFKKIEKIKAKEKKKEIGEAKTDEDSGCSLRAKVVPWKSGLDIARLLQNITSNEDASEL